MWSEETIEDTLNDLNVCMSLRKPQREALAVFSEVLELLKWEKTTLSEQLDRIRTRFLTVTSFEREFPSICFSMATGVGKTRLMAACMAYLHRVKGVNNFFVVAPNRTIYEKLRRDFSQSYPDKYVFSGLYDFVDQPQIIDGDNFNVFIPEQQRIEAPGFSKVTIHIFNIAKLTHGRGKDAERARVMRLHEVLGQSYFDYLKSLPHLCVMMDESHHYHAEQGFGVINDLNPMLGVEFTATPQIQTNRGKVTFKNVVYEYSLAHALNDKKYVKEPVVWTRQDFDPSQYTDEQLDWEKLIDGIRLHIDTRAKLDVYARNYGKPFVKPFVLVVAKDIAHSRRIREFLTSPDFYNGYYADKVLEINSKQGKVESDENTELLLGLEKPDNRIEIVIHVDKLKEGWDVTNLYTIIPLRASASETLTEQTLGRGLRLPYGERTKIDEVDRLSIVSHDKYQAIVELANEPQSLVRQVNYIDSQLFPDCPDAEVETVELKPMYDVQTSSENFTAEIAEVFNPEIPQATRTRIAFFVAETTASNLVEKSRHAIVSSTNVRNNPEYRKLVQTEVFKQIETCFPEVPVPKEEIYQAVEKAYDFCVEALTDTVIPIPELIVNPRNVGVYHFDDFTLNTQNLYLRPVEESIIGQELSEGGKRVKFAGLETILSSKPKDTPENEVAKYIIAKDNIDYGKCHKLIFTLIFQVKEHFLSYLSPEDTDNVLRGQARTVADYIYAQMNEHFHESTLEYESGEVRPFTRIESSFGYKVKSDSIYDFRATLKAGEIRQKIFKGFQKACHTLYKFDSFPELNFARILEQDDEVLKWLRPSPKQFHIYWGKSRQNYEPDFVVETKDAIYLVEVKAQNEVSSPEVLEKRHAAEEYCRTVSQWNETHEGKPWKYAIVADSDIFLQSSFQYLIGDTFSVQSGG